MLYGVHLAWAVFELTTSVVIGTDCTCSCKSNYHIITTSTALSLLEFQWDRNHQAKNTTDTAMFASYLDLSLDIGCEEQNFMTKERISIFPLWTVHLYVATFQQHLQNQELFSERTSSIQRNVKLKNQDSYFSFSWRSSWMKSASCE
jgi:hypothetical protein